MSRGPGSGAEPGRRSQAAPPSRRRAHGRCPRRWHPRPPRPEPLRRSPTGRRCGGDGSLVGRPGLVAPAPARHGPPTERPPPADRTVHRPRPGADRRPTRPRTTGRPAPARLQGGPTRRPCPARRPGRPRRRRDRTQGPDAPRRPHLPRDALRRRRSPRSRRSHAGSWNSGHRPPRAKRRGPVRSTPGSTRSGRRPRVRPRATIALPRPLARVGRRRWSVPRCEHPRPADPLPRGSTARRRAGARTRAPPRAGAGARRCGCPPSAAGVVGGRGRPPSVPPLPPLGARPAGRRRGRSPLPGCCRRRADAAVR